MDNISEKLKLLGLTSREGEVYYYILRNQPVFLTKLRELTKMSLMGISRLVKSMTAKGVIKTVKIKNKSLIVPTNIKELRKRKFNEIDNKLREVRQLAAEIESAYGDYDIKVKRLGQDVYLDEINKHVLENVNIYEFHDFKTIIIPRGFLLRKFKNQKPKILYNCYKDKYHHTVAKKVKISEEQHLPSIITANNKVFFVVSGKEAIEIENETIEKIISKSRSKRSLINIDASLLAPIFLKTHGQ